MEKQFIQWLEENHSTSQSPVRGGIGDDAAILLSDGEVVVATDSIADGTHFLLEQHSLTQIGHKAIAVNLSDLAAMGAKPLAATVNFTCPKSFELTEVKELFSGIASTAKQYGVQIIGGDTNRWDGKLVVGVTVFGTMHLETVSDFWRMDGAKAGDAILVTGTLGGSIARKHIEFQPRVSAAKYLFENHQVNAATDITDSLAIDLAAVAIKSNCGFQIDTQSIPISEDAETLARETGRIALDHALYDGEDFELLLAVGEAEAEKIVAEQNCGCPITCIGKFDSSGKFMIINEDNSELAELKIEGFIH